MTVIGVLPAELVIDLIAHHLYGLKLQERLRADVGEPERRALAKAPAVPLALQATRRDKRRQNSARRKSA